MFGDNKPLSQKLFPPFTLPEGLLSLLYLTGTFGCNTWHNHTPNNLRHLPGNQVKHLLLLLGHFYGDSKLYKFVTLSLQLSSQK